MINKSSIPSTIGGQAVLDGVMMKSDTNYTVAIRATDHTIKVLCYPFLSYCKKFPVLNVPIIRGAVNFFQMLKLGNTVLQLSANETLGEDTTPSPLERWLSKIFGGSISSIITFISLILGLTLSVVLFMFFPIALTSLFENSLSVDLGVWRNLLEGLFRIAILLAYLWTISRMKDMKVLFSYHGAEHKAIACYESGEELTPHNAQAYTRFHPRCGTSFIFVIIMIGILFYSLPIFRWNGIISRVLMKLLLFPIVAGIGYEFIRFAGKHMNTGWVRFLSSPGLWLQRITTREPSIEQLEVAISAINALENRSNTTQISINQSEGA
ncbi:MAG: DUF1385 domain-containing protein [Oscillospiraceae bacterium]|nr:DUF1385 domain-containing protein [Oscillospiraceae bacterium]